MTRMFALAASLLLACAARAELPRTVSQAFVDAGVPLHSVAVVVQARWATDVSARNLVRRPLRTASQARSDRASFHAAKRNHVRISDGALRRL